MFHNVPISIDINEIGLAVALGCLGVLALDPTVELDCILQFGRADDSQMPSLLARSRGSTATKNLPLRRVRIESHETGATGAES